ncbi:DNA-directed RNA polymerase subunit delta [Bacillus subtilis]|uniref:DNA-directed RNA polymerase subunit delta n=1 Tax=Bacillus subtilis TaxID=1423 RepID=UPI0005C905A2|nr:DNA-directed RNA polymerase subunit delta [Bacillus subtilis]KIX83493.1 DNA-directed RNA polymerase subunit delta [Bacillus subtilis]6ZFB_D Chain D, DNA-directed RNA polymerase subunit delta [Bacillus subtilis]6ZFB_d Chain d, DNA-directed RNA polymerase subunit delta [Bacillus subtilis]
MGIKQYSQEELKEMALVEIAHELFEEHKKPVPFQELLNEIASLLGVKKEELGDRIAQFYTDLNIDGRFLALSDQTWGLRSWYPYDQLDEETQPTVKAKKKKAKKAVEEDLDEDDDDLEIEEDIIDEDDEDYDDEEEEIK